MAWLPNGQYQNLSQRVKDGTSCFLASKIPLDEDGVSNNENTDLVFKRTKRKIKSKKKRSDRKLGLSPPGTRHHLHLRSTVLLQSIYKKEDEELDVSDKSSGSKHSGQGRG
uniref:Uncharacterized protein n=1 Tax=Brassica campestris TaxID=3711 RepID=A0A3P6ASW3_BRACM|nr:unnamed protein product [Brassica rapa]